MGIVFIATLAARCCAMPTASRMILVFGGIVIGRDRHLEIERDLRRIEDGQLLRFCPEDHLPKQIGRRAAPRSRLQLPERFSAARQDPMAKSGRGDMINATKQPRIFKLSSYFTPL
ncbi:hypothetical protein NKJ81_30575 [Mesorhizobium sp. M0018]|uniref:hypothetical protein n=1 Tax=Mesorhizobium sp. M0018 TaxID=2956844 RepID=UPI003335E884